MTFKAILILHILFGGSTAGVYEEFSYFETMEKCQAYLEAEINVEREPNVAVIGYCKQIEVK